MSGHSPWMTVIVVDLPSLLPVGLGNIKVVTGPNVIHPVGAYKVDNLDIALEIISEGGINSSFSFMGYEYHAQPRVGDLNSLKPRKQILVKGMSSLVNYVGNANKVCAAELILSVPVINITDPTEVIQDSATIVIHDSTKFDIAAKTQMSWLRSENNLNVMFISPTCELRDRMIRFSILADIYSGIDFSGEPSLISGRYFNEFGEEISGYAPELVLMNF